MFENLQNNIFLIQILSTLQEVPIIQIKEVIDPLLISSTQQGTLEVTLIMHPCSTRI